ncbi:beta strand repeat-containing protein [Dactylosporangium sp. NPDC000521]|uniref:beta strand repeat-containing protein n=1 Tax=Dactylosporangium sp. NPDC000521 TaxID=3363975 RepID=UPI0036C4B5CF
MTFRIAIMALLLLPAAVAGMARSAAADIVDAFRPVYSVNDSGSIVLRGNANLTCDDTSPTCTAARNGGGTGGQLNNNGYKMRHVDVDDEPTVNSSTADLPVPDGATVLYAGLFWGGDTAPGTGTPAPDESRRNTVKFKVPGGAYRTITANRLTDVTTFPGHRPYQGYADVSSLVAGAGGGTYAVADIQAATGVNDRYAAWSLAVVLHDPAQPVRNLVVYDGFGSVRGITPADATVSIPVTGFQTPPTGAVTTSLGAVAYEGDAGSGGDSVRLDGTPLTDARNPATNFFNSTVSDHGAAVTARNPADTNLLGFDIDQVDASGVLANGANSATITLQTTAVTGETFYPGVITFATDLYAPRLTAVKTATDVNGGDLERGDEIRYTIEVGNDGLAPAEDAQLADAVPPGTTFVPGSLTIDGATQSDPVDTDRAEFSADVVVFRIGTGSDATHGGHLAVGDKVVAGYRVTAGAPGATGATSIRNVAHAAATGTDTGVKLRTPSNPATQDLPATGPAADLAVTAAGPRVVQGAGPVRIPVTLTNTGPATATGVTLTAVLPAGVSGDPASAGPCAWAAAQALTCPVGTLTAGATFTVDVVAIVSAAAAHHTEVTAAVTSSTTDPVAANDTATAAVVRNTAPAPVPDAATVAAGGTVTIPAAANDTDPDGDTVRVAGIATPPTGGHAIVDATGTVRYTAGQHAGTDTFTYVAADANGGTATSTVTVTVTAAGPPGPDAAPVAADDTVTVPTGATSATFDPLANDTDPDGDQLTVIGIGGDGSGAPAGGTVTRTASGMLVYTPREGFRGADSFTYTVGDGNGGHSTATVTVTAADRAPVAGADERSTPAGTPVDVDVLANDTDPDPGDPLTVAAWDATTTHGGTVTRSGGLLRYAPAAGFSGDDTFTYTVSDGNGSSTGTVTVHVGPAGAPAPRADAASTPTGTPVTVDVLANDADPAATVTSVTPGAHGTTAIGAGGTVTYTPRGGFSGVDTFSYAVSDGRGGLGTATVTVTVFNQAPVGVDDTLRAPAGGAVVVPVLANDTDANADTLRAVAATGAAHGTLRIVGGTVQYTPVAGYRGADSFTYTLSDGNGGTSTAAVTLDVTGGAPVAGADAVATAPGVAVTVTVIGNDSDPDGDPLTVAAAGRPGHGGTVLNGDGTVTYTPADGFEGVDTFTYTLRDATGLQGTGTVTVTVGPHTGPVVVTTPMVTTPAGSGAKTITPLDNVKDPDGDPLKVVGVTQPANGTAVLNADGTVTYTPDKGFTGADAFTYTVTDGTATVAGTVEVMVGAVDLPVTGGAVAPHAIAGLLMLLAGWVLRFLPALSFTSGRRPGSRA